MTVSAEPETATGVNGSAPRREFRFGVEVGQAG